jgi:hypothetical protein
MGTVVTSGALVEGLEIDGVLQSTVFDESALGNMLVVLGQAHDKTEVDLGVGIEFASAEFEDVAETLGRAVLALDSVVSGRPGVTTVSMRLTQGHGGGGGGSGGGEE